MVSAPASCSTARSRSAGSSFSCIAAIDLAEASQKPWKMTLDFDVDGRMLAQLLQALAIVQDAVAQPRAENLLHVGEALVAQGLAEAHQRRGLHLGLLGDRGDGAEGDLVRILQREGGDLGQALRQRLRALGDQRLEGGEIARRA